MGDVFRFKVGDVVQVGSERAEVLEVLIGRDAYKVRLLGSLREMTIQSRLVKPIETKTIYEDDLDDAEDEEE